MPAAPLREQFRLNELNLLESSRHQVLTLKEKCNLSLVNLKCFTYWGCKWIFGFSILILLISATQAGFAKAAEPFLYLISVFGFYGAIFGFWRYKLICLSAYLYMGALSNAITSLTPH